MKITIIGGGTAGWLSALYFISRNIRTDKKTGKVINENIWDITVIDTDKVPIIGAGEGSTGLLADAVALRLKHIPEITEWDFLTKTESTLKLGIRFKDWNGIGTEFLSPIQPTETANFSLDYHFAISAAYGKSHLSVLNGWMMENEYSSFYTDKKHSTLSHAYHFDAHKVGQFFKDVALKYNVKHINAEVVGLNRNGMSGDLDSVKLDDGSTFESDMWIDCSGFARVLIKPMGGGWKTYSEHLPTNSAIPFLQQYEKDENILAETLAWAQPNGWMWQIPTQARYGSGYVYCDHFTNYENAVDELQKNIGKKIEPIKNLKFEAGRVEKCWVNNVIAMGLSAGFLEPLQATSIHSTIVQLDSFVLHKLMATKEETCLESSRELFNRIIANLFDEFRDLIQIQYMNDREDTEFWKYCKYGLPKTDRVKQILETCKYRVPSHNDFDGHHGVAGWGVWCWTLDGLRHFSIETAKKHLKLYRFDTDADLAYNQVQKNFNTYAYRLIKNKQFIELLKAGKITKPIMDQKRVPISPAQ